MDPTTDADTGISLKEFLDTMRRRRMVIGQSVVIIGVLATVLTLMSHPVYQASARLLVQQPTSKISAVDGSNPISELLTLAEAEPVSTQVQVLQSPSLIAKVSKATGANVGAITVKQVEETNVIECTAEASSAQNAARIANTLLEFYLDQESNRSLMTIKNAEEFAAKQGEAARSKLTQTEDALEAFKQKHKVSELAAERTQLGQHVGQLQSAVEDTRAKLVSLQRYIAAQKSLLTQQPETLSSITKTTNPAITATQEKIEDLQVQRRGIAGPGRYATGAPQVKALDDQISSLQRRLATLPALVDTQQISPNGAVRATKDKLIDLEAQEASQVALLAKMEQELAMARSAVGHFAGWEVTLQRLARDHDAAETQYMMFTAKLADLRLREKAHQPSASILESAHAPEAPIRPKKVFNIVLGLMFGLFVGICLALLQDFLDDRITNSEQADRLLGLPSLGHVPALSVEDARLLPQMKGLDPAAESYRILRTNIHFASIDAPVRTLLVTSANPGEGKTTTSANLAFAMAMDGKRVILVDADLRRPSLAKLLGVAAVPGLTDILLGHASLTEALHPMDYLPNLMVLPAGSVPPNPGELLNSRTFREVVAQLKDRSDVVVFDSPPGLVAADAAILASQMDGTVLVIETGSTKRGSAQHMVGILKQSRANVLGIAYNKMKAQDGSYYYHYNYKYVTSDLPVPENGVAPRLESPREAAVSAEKRER
jgi:capsular exopolysaccharide synthesis family protein